jgi:aldose 1-epimerase
MCSSPTSRTFGKLPNGADIQSWRLRGEGGLTLESITFGAIITRLILPDGRDVVLGFDDLLPYIGEHPYFGAMVGRVAGRLTGAAFELEGYTYSLARNDAGNTLHGGVDGFDKRVWTATPSVRRDGSPSLRLELWSADGDQGFPGDLHVMVDYTVTPDNTVLIETTTTTNKSTPLSLTNHSYFNLSGHGCSNCLLDHELQVNSGLVVAVHADFTLLDRVDCVNSSSDLRTARVLGEAVRGFPAEHGAMYFNSAGNVAECVARLSYPKSGWGMECFTDASYLQIYTGSHINRPINGKGSATYEKFAGLCLECQNYPNAANAPQMDVRGVLRAGETQRTMIAYKFSQHAQGSPDGPAN